MNAIISDIAFTPAVKALQTKHGSRAAYQKMEIKGGWQNTVTSQLAAFLAERDSFYFATATADFPAPCGPQTYVNGSARPRGSCRRRLSTIAR